MKAVAICPAGCWQRDTGDVELSERAGAGEREEIEARRASRILRSPPRLDRGDVADDSRRPVGEPVGRARWAHVGDVDREARGRVRHAVDGADPVPHHGNGRRRAAGAAAPSAATVASPTRSRLTQTGTSFYWRYRRTRASSRSVHVFRCGSKCPASGGAVRPGDSARVGGEALVGGAAASPRGTGRRRAHGRRDGPRAGMRAPCRPRPRAAIAARGPPCAGGPGRARRAPAASAGRTRSSELGERRPQLGELERRQVDEPRARARRALERAQQVVDRPELGLLGQHARPLQLGHERAR